MRREAITLVMAMAIGTVLMAACDKTPTPEAQKNAGAMSPSTTGTPVSSPEKK